LIRTSAAAVLVCLLQAVPVLAQAGGEIQGRVLHSDAGVRGVTVLLLQRDAVLQETITAPDGSFAMKGVAPGSYSVVLTLGERVEYLDNVNVTDGAVVTVEKNVEWQTGFNETVTVYAASRRLERISDAPAAITSVPAELVRLQAVSGQLPRALEFTPGAEASQSGVYDYNLNVRGFNTQLNRRIQTLVDGRDPSIPFLSSQEWAAMSFLADDIASMELVRGPSAALYGPNAFNGVLDIRTLAPRDSQGGRVKLVVGELNTARVSGRWAGDLGRGWFLKVIGGTERSDTFARSRHETVEYAGVPREAIPLSRDHMNVSSGSARVDRYLPRDRLLTVEGGATALQGTVLLTTTGRTQPDAVRTWTRLNVNSPRWNALFFSNGRTTENQPALSSGAPLWLADRNYHVEFQANQYYAAGIRAVGGAAYTRQTVDSADEAGRQTLLTGAVTTHLGGVFGQIDYQVTPRVKVVGAARLDDSTLHDVQFSPKGAVVYNISGQHAVRVSVNRAFQVANYAELYISVPVGAPINLSGLEAAFRPLLGDTSLGFNRVPIFVRGNENLKVETIRALEVGYTATFGSRALVTVNAYRNAIRDFITDALPGVNPAYPPWMAPSSVPPPVRGIVERAVNTAVSGITNVDGAPAVVLSLGNTGRVTSYGTELGVHWQVHPRIVADAAYSAFGFSVRDTASSTSIHPNAPSHQFAVGGAYEHPRMLTSLRYRRVTGFPWASGRYVGDVPAYGVAALDTTYRVNEVWDVGLSVSNLLNEKHYEVFGGDVLRRRALVTLGYSWK
jgi:iron complex outermembrane receptor protein